MLTLQNCFLSQNRVFPDLLLKNRCVFLPFYILITDGKILLIADSNISFCLRNNFFSTENILVITQDSLLFMNKIFLNAEKICLTQIEFKNHDMIELLGKLSDRTMTSTWILHAKRLFELESRRYCHFSIEQRAPYENSDITEVTRHIASIRE